MEEVRQAFNTGAEDYDSQRRWVIPDMDRFYTAAVRAASTMAQRPQILDIGAGTGLFSAMILKKFPDAHLTLLDFSENMLTVARKRFSGRENIRFVTGDYSTSDLGSGYDLVCSALSIHHLEREDKRRLYGRIYSALKPGGLFVNAEQCEAATPLLHDIYMEYWDDFLGKGPLEGDEKKQVLARRKALDKMETLPVQLGWLRDAGFTGVDVFYKNRFFIVFSGKKEMEIPAAPAPA